MKKNYISPMATVVKIGECQLLSSSDMGISSETTDQQLAPDMDFDDSEMY